MSSDNQEQRDDDAAAFDLSGELTGLFVGEEWDAVLNKLEPFRRRFVEEYLTCFNLAEAYRRSLTSPVGSDDRQAHNHAKSVFKHLDVKRAIREGMALMAKRYERVQDRIIEELTYLGFSNMGDYIDVHKDGFIELDLSKATYEQMSAIQEITVEKIVKGTGDTERTIYRTKFRLYDKYRAMEMLVKRFQIEAPKEKKDPNGDGIEIEGGLPE